jgi:hypothetical protein
MRGCDECGYSGLSVETHAFHAVLDGERVHAMTLIEDWSPRERRETVAALTDLLGMVTG